MTESKNMFKIPNNNLHPNIFWKSFLNKCIKSKETIANLNKLLDHNYFFYKSETMRTCLIIAVIYTT